MSRAPEYRVVGEHRILARLGEGGQGVVYLGESSGGTRVAIKVLHPDAAADAATRRRFLREAEVAASVAAFCTARVIGTGLVEERPYIISEYVPGPSLDELVKREGPRSGSGLERLAVSTLTALASIHAAGVVHRDFKPSNVVLGPEGPVVIDFGIARVLDHMTNSTQVAGTPSYMSPEQFTEQPLTPASDMFSWAGTMVFAATGHSAFPARTVPAVLNAILHGTPDVSGVPESLLPMVIACLAKDAAARPGAAQLLAGLTGSGRGQGSSPRDSHTLVVPPRADGAPTEPTARRRTSGVKIAAGAVGVALLAVAGVVVVPSWVGGQAVVVQPGDGLDLAVFSKSEVDDRFPDGSSGRYATYRPFPGEALPAVVVGGGKFAASSAAPFFGLVGGRTALSSGQAVSVLTVGAFAGTGQYEDSVFVGWVEDGDNYVTAWYNNTRKSTGFDLRVKGQFRKAPKEIPVELGAGDRFALLLTGGDVVTSYVERGGKWRKLHSAALADVLATPQARARFRYGFGVRGTSGTIALTRAEGRAVPG